MSRCVNDTERKGRERQARLIAYTAEGTVEGGACVVRPICSGVMGC